MGCQLSKHAPLLPGESLISANVIMKAASIIAPGVIASWLLPVAAVVEGATGLALIGNPQAVASLLLGAEPAAIGVALGRVTGIALLALALVCWMSRREARNAAVIAGMLAYNALVTAYLMYLGFGVDLIGILLKPAIAIHAAMTLLFGYVWLGDQPTRASTQ